MSKTKTLKKKTTGFDILYRVVTAIACVAIYPIFYFADLIHIIIAHKTISDALNAISGGNTLHVTEEFLSIPEIGDFVNMFSSFGDSNFDIKTILQNPIYRPLLVAIAFVAVALLLGIVILGFAVFSNKIKVIIGLSGAGFLSTVAAYIAFNIFSNSLVSSGTPLAELLNIEGFVLQLIVNLVGEVAALDLCGAFWGIMFIMLGICVWSVSIFIVNRSEEKEKAVKKAERAAKHK